MCPHHNRPRSRGWRRSMRAGRPGKQWLSQGQSANGDRRRQRQRGRWACLQQLPSPRCWQWQCECVPLFVRGQIRMLECAHVRKAAFMSIPRQLNLARIAHVFELKLLRVHTACRSHTRFTWISSVLNAVCPRMCAEHCGSSSGRQSGTPCWCAACSPYSRALAMALMC